MPTNLDFKVAYRLNGEKHIITPDMDWHTEKIPKGSDVTFRISDFGYVLFEKEDQD